jgi:hypothetical protein
MWKFALVVVVVMLGTSTLARYGDALDPRPGSSDAASCTHARHPVRVRVSRRRWPHVADHISDVRGRFPRVWHIDRRDAAQHRLESLRAVPTVPRQDRDEWPPAMRREGGEDADVRLVPSRENRSQGSAMGARLRPYCNGTPFKLVVRR